jgi:hypothetical protein
MVINILVIKISFNIKYVQDKLIFLNEEEILYPHDNVTFSHLYIKSSSYQKNIQASVDFNKFVFDNAEFVLYIFYVKTYFNDQNIYYHTICGKIFFANKRCI